MGDSNFISIRAIVDFPDPDSPTRAIVLPACSVNDTSFTACNTRDRNPERNEKSFTNPRASNDRTPAVPATAAVFVVIVSPPA
ncbi:hypothetical protein [Streptomyces sp. AC495_CC817]|uniref:hypothetical protein n=1 Tax=Streptomyces sp. AC495_CC817 TaxID=2823900 RepID=UPI0027E1615E|nr:hypothetical protein [Streptomyces sp. AC495_CC817]